MKLKVFRTSRVQRRAPMDTCAIREPVQKMQSHVLKDTIVPHKPLTPLCSTTSVMQGFTARWVQGMRPKPKTTALKHTTVRRVRVFMITLPITLITQAGEAMLLLDVRKDLDSIGPTQSASYLNATSTRTIHF